MKAKKTGKKSYVQAILISAAIFTVLVFHFVVSQFIALKSEADSSVSELINKQPVAVEARSENKTAEEIIAPVAAAAKEATAPTVERRETRIEPKRAVESEPVDEKKPARETRTERLRRAEKILTGI